MWVECHDPAKVFKNFDSHCFQCNWKGLNFCRSYPCTHWKIENLSNVLLPISKCALVWEHGDSWWEMYKGTGLFYLMKCCNYFSCALFLFMYHLHYCCGLWCAAQCSCFMLRLLKCYGSINSDNNSIQCYTWTVSKCWDRMGGTEKPVVLHIFKFHLIL